MNDENQSIDQVLRSAMPDDAPAEVRARLAEQLAAFRARAVSQGTVAPRRAPVRSTWWGVGISAAAVVAIAATLALLVAPRSSLAEAASALARQPWVHVSSGRPDGKKVETWYSLPRDVVAFRSARMIEYRDHRLDVYHRYDKRDKVLYRLPEFRRSRESSFEALAAAMTLLAQQEQTLENPLEHLGFLGSDLEGMKVIDQKLEKVTEGGHTWLDYRLSVSHPTLAEPVRMLFRVDAETKLPRLFRREGVWQGRHVTDEARFEYPDHGPADVYALGVPKSAKLVDRVPKGDLKRILDTLQAGRERMDDYRAIFVNRSEPSDYDWWCELPYVWCRKGRKFRADYVSGWQGHLMTDPPAADEDLHAWWNRRVEFFRWYPQYVMHGSTSYRAEVISKAGGKEIVAVKRHESNVRPSEVVPVEYSMRPEFACRPPMGIGDPHQEAILEMNPAEGPAGCILLTVRHTNAEGRINEKGIGLADENRYWLDPARDYIVMRWDIMTVDEQGQPKIHESDIVEQVARSPGGVWYATKVRRKNTVRFPDGKLADQVYYLYVDFDVDFTDSFFDPPQPGKLD